MKPTPYKRRPPVSKNRIIIGRKPMIEALNTGASIEKIFVLKTASGEEISMIKRLARQREIPVSAVPVEKLHRFSTSNHQGVIGLAALIEFQPLQAVISALFERGETPFFFLLDGVTDTRNLGAIARSAYCYGAHGLIIPAGHNAAITEDALKTSAGALEHLTICRTNNAADAFSQLQLNGIALWAAALRAPKSLGELDFSLPAAVVLGSEDTGISSFVEKRADETFQIPMANTFDSLNVSVAAGIILYERMRQIAPH